MFPCKYYKIFSSDSDLIRILFGIFSRTVLVRVHDLRFRSGLGLIRTSPFHTLALDIYFPHHSDEKQK